MIRAALYAWNRGAVVVIDDATTPPTIVRAIDFYVGDDVDVKDLLGDLERDRVERLATVALGGPHPAPAQALALQLSLAAGLAGIELATVDETTRKAQRGPATKLCPRGAGTEAARDALALILADMAETTPAATANLPPEVAQTSRELAEVLVSASPISRDHPSHRFEGATPQCACGAYPGENGIAQRPCPLTAYDEARSAPPGPRIAGIDPGERWIAVEVTEGVALPLRHVDSLIIELPPKPTDEDMDTAVGEVLGFLEAHHVERAAVERVLNVHRGTKEGAALAGLSTGLLRGQYIAGIIRGALRAAHRYDAAGQLVRSVPHVESVSSVKWRNHARKLAGLACKKGVPWEPAVRAALTGLPTSPGEHVLDAAGACLWAARPPEEEKPVRRKPKGPAVPRRPGKAHSGGHAARDAAREATRLAAGCACPTDARGKVRHVKDVCPIAIAANEKRKASMTGNKNRTAKGDPS